MHWIALFFALQGAFMRAFIPAGYMPAFNADGLRLAFCSPSGAQLTLEGHALDSSSQRSGECMFALALSAVVPPAQATIAATQETDASPSAVRATVAALITTAYFARGPPLLV